MNGKTPVTDIYKRVLKRQSLDTTYDGNYKNLRNKFNFLMNEVLFRDKMNFGTTRKTYISNTEVPYVEELLYRATSGYEEDKLFCDWFNGNIATDDYERIFQLGKDLEVLLTEVYEKDEKWNTDEVTKNEWINALQSSIHYDTALTALKIKHAINSLEIASSGISHNIPFGEIIRQSNGNRACVSFNQCPVFDVSAAPITEVFKYCLSREDYMDTILNIIELMICDATKKTIDFIKVYAEIKKIRNITNIDQLIEKDYFASEYLGFFNEIYEYLFTHPDSLKEIESEIGTDNLLEFFKVSDRNAGRKKK